jgi:hypothetical protein
MMRMTTAADAASFPTMAGIVTAVTVLVVKITIIPIIPMTTV